MPKIALEIANLLVSFQAETKGQRKIVIDNFSLQIMDNEIVALLAPSGAGKSTLLNTIAGIIPPDAGSISFDGVDLAKTAIEHRNFGLLFQDGALFPNMSVAKNIAFGLKTRKFGNDETEKRVHELLQMVDLEGFGERSIQTLSGGEKQRVALARTLAPEPRFIMLDEPLSSLDEKLRLELAEKIRVILKNSKIPALLVTHSKIEAEIIADRIITSMSM